MNTLRIKIDRSVCMGSGNCVDVAPEQFDQDDTDGLVILKDESISSGNVDSVHDAVSFCPVQAITIIG